MKTGNLRWIVSLLILMSAWQCAFFYDKPSVMSGNFASDFEPDLVINENRFLRQSGKAFTPKEKLFKVGRTPVWQLAGDGKVFFFKSGMSIDADGAPDAYHPEDKGADYLANAGRPGKWWAIVTDTGRPDGIPVIQTESDPNPGYFVSMTALIDSTKPRNDPKRYTDSNRIPYIVLPKDMAGSARLGDYCLVFNKKNNMLAYAIFADIGPKGKIGEGSVALARKLGISSDPRKGGTKDSLLYVVFPQSGDKKPQSTAKIRSAGAKLFTKWGGIHKLKNCL